MFWSGLVSVMTVMNMLVGVLVEVVGTVAAVENEMAIVTEVRTKISEILQYTANDGKLSKSEFDGLLLDRDTITVIQNIGVDPVGLAELRDFIFLDRDEITYVEFMELVMNLRGNNLAKQRDIVDMKRFAQVEH